VSRLRQDENWFPNLGIPIIDVGILPRAISESRELAVIEGDGMIAMDNRNYYTVDSFG
jgi:hypothetical protein